jgi:hypothetical protein
MLNSRLQTQPLDPAVLAAYENRLQKPASAATTPLLEPLPVSKPDNMALSPLSPKSGVPAQSSHVTAALETEMTQSQAELLLTISSQLAEMQQHNPAALQEVMNTLQALTSQGAIDFSALTGPQRTLLQGLGLTEANAAGVYQQLHALLMPTLQGQTSTAYQQVQASVSTFLSNVDLKQQTFQNIERQAQDLSRVQGMVANLSAGSINDLLADQTAGVFDLSVSKITGRNFDIKNDMDYVLGHFVVLSQEAPATLQQVESTLKKLQQDQPVTEAERQTLNRYGLTVNSENKLETYDKRVLNFNEVQRLENVVFSMTDPSDGYGKVLQASADVIRQSRKLEELSERARFETVQVQTTTVQVQQQSADIAKLRTDALVLDQKIHQAKTKADQLENLVDATTVLAPGAPPAISPALLAQFNVQVVPSANGHRFYVQGREVNRLQLMQHLGSLLQNQQGEIQDLAGELARKKTDALVATATLVQTTQNLEVQTEQLEKTQTEIKVETIKLQELELIRGAVVESNWDSLKPEEQNIYARDVEPQIKVEVKRVQAKAEEVQLEIARNLSAARTAIEGSLRLQAQVREDAKRWEQTLAVAEQSLARLADKAEELKKPPVTEGDPTAVNLQRVNPDLPLQQPKLYQPDLRPEDDSATLDAREAARSQTRVQQQLDATTIARQQTEEVRERERAQERANTQRYEQDQQIFQREQEAFLKAQD